MTINWPPPGLGWIVAIIVLILLILLLILNQVTIHALAWCLVALAVARLV